MFQTYVHLTGTDIDQEFLARQGIRRPESQRPTAMQAQICRHCSTINAPGHQFCAQCAEPLTDETEIGLTTAVQEIEGHPVYQQLMAEMQTRIQALTGSTSPR